VDLADRLALLLQVVMIGNTLDVTAGKLFAQR
jgi:hypothetical protein